MGWRLPLAFKTTREPFNEKENRTRSACERVRRAVSANAFATGLGDARRAQRRPRWLEATETIRRRLENNAAASNSAAPRSDRL
jgi:hypothetical protein